MRMRVSQADRQHVILCGLCERPTCVSVEAASRGPTYLTTGNGEYRRDIGAHKFSWSRAAYISTFVPNAWLELWQRTHGGSYMQSWAMSGRHGRALFRISNLEIYGTPDTRILNAPLFASRAPMHRCIDWFATRGSATESFAYSSRTIRWDPLGIPLIRKATAIYVQRNGIHRCNAFWSFVSRALIVSGIYRILHNAAVAVCRITALEENLKGGIGFFEERASEI